MSRVVSTILLVDGARRQVQLTRENFPFFMARPFPATPGYLDVITTWDGQYYWTIAADGYPVDGAGLSGGQQSPWAFPPGFPMLTRAFMAASGAPFPLVATVVNTVVGAVAMVVLYTLVRRSADRFLTVAVVSLTSFFVSAPLFQMAFSESLGFLLLVLALRDIGSRQWLRAGTWTVLLSLVRIITPPLALVVAAVLWRQRRTQSLQRRDIAGGAIVAALALGGAVLWSIITTVVPNSDAVGAGAASRRTSTLGTLTVRWVDLAWTYWGAGGALLSLLLIGVVILMPLTRTGRAMGVELSTWLWAYPLFLFTVTGIIPGVLRYFLLAPGVLVPMLGPVRTRHVGRWVALACLLALLVVWQKWWVDALVVIDSTEQRFGP